MSSTSPPGPPYKPQVASVGGVAKPVPDVPISVVLLLLYVGSAAANMAIFQINRRRKHKFILSALLFGFSMARILTLSLRIGSAYHPDNVSLLIAATIFLNAGILLVYIINILFVTRILRARQPELGWHPALRIFFKVVYGLVAVALVMVIVFINISYYTLNASTKQTARDCQLAAITYLLFVAALPLVLLAVTHILPKSPKAETFGAKSMKMKSVIVAISAALCTLGAGFKAGINWEPARPLNDPAWYQSRAAFYIFYFVLEIVILYMLLYFGIDKRFHVPNGSSKRNTFAAEPSSDLEDQPRSETRGAPSSSRPSAETEKEGEP